MQFQTPPIHGAALSSTPEPATQDTHLADGNIKFNDKVVWNRASMPLRAAWLPEFANDELNDSIERARNNLHDMDSG